LPPYRPFDDGALNLPTRSSNLALAITVVEALADPDHSKVLASLDDDIVYESPFYPSTPTVRGRESFRELVEHVHRIFSRVAFDVVDAFSAEDPDRVIVECRGDSVVAATSVPYKNHYLIILRFSTGRIVEWREFSNPIVYQAALTAI